MSNLLILLFPDSSNEIDMLVGIVTFIFSDVSVIGSMAKYVSGYNGADFQPMNANFGIIAPPDRKVKGGKRGRYDYYATRAVEYIESLKELIP